MSLTGDAAGSVATSTDQWISPESARSMSSLLRWSGVFSALLTVDREGL
jgi:hypothetical protein